jgi:transposase
MSELAKVKALSAELQRKEDTTYRYLDTLAARGDQIVSLVQSYVVRNYPSSVGYVLYDVTTLYFETDTEDQNEGLRKFGYSKDHRNDLPQIVLGLAVNELGMPLTYKLYEGNTFEGDTFIDGVEQSQKAACGSQITVVADAGMLSNKNLAKLEEKGITYIVAARLKSLSTSTKEKILGLDYTNSQMHELVIDNKRLIVTYSQNRAKKSANSRKRSIERLEKLIDTKRALRKHQYLDMTLAEQPKLNINAISEAERWDGLKGYWSNDKTLTADQIIAHYADLYKVEQSFRMSKSDLRIRPAFHIKRERIEAHVLICMIALLVMRVIEERVKPLGLTYGRAIGAMSLAQSGLISDGKKTFVIEPEYTTTQKNILKILKVPT